MIQVDISNVWAQASLRDLLSLEAEVAAAHQSLAEGSAAGGDHRPWLKLPAQDLSGDVFRIQLAAEKIRTDSQICVVVGTESACLGSRAAVSLLQGNARNRTQEGPRLYYAGSDLSTRRWNELTALLSGSDFSLIVISGSQTPLETSLAFRGLKFLLERKYGTDEANGRIYAVAPHGTCPLRQLAQEGNWQLFALPAGVPEPFSVLSAAGLLPMAVADVDILQVLRGSAEAMDSYDLRSFENPVWLYAALRCLMARSGKTAELFSCFEPSFRFLGRWWQQLMSAAVPSGAQGVLPVPLELPGQMPAALQPNLFETLVRFDPSQPEMSIISDVRDPEGLNFLEGKTLSFVEEQAYWSTVESHADSGIGVICMDCGPLTEQTLGELFYFLELACAVSACVMGADPFAQSDAALYRQNFHRLMGKPQPESP